MVLRRILGVVAGILIANLFIFGWEWVGHQLPLGRADSGDLAVQPDGLAAMPPGPKLWVVAGWLLGAFLGALVAFRAARWDYAGWIVGALVAAAGVVNIFLIPHPLWMALSAVALPLVGALFAFGVYRRMRAADLHLRG